MDKSSLPMQRCASPRSNRKEREMGSDLIQVPRRLLEELAGYLDREGEPMVSVPGNGEWTQSMIRKLKAEVARYPGALAVGDEAARNPGQLVGLNDVAQHSRISKQEIS